MKQETTKALDRFDDVQKAIEFTQSDSAHRIDSQARRTNALCCHSVRIWELVHGHAGIQFKLNASFAVES